VPRLKQPGQSLLRGAWPGRSLLRGAWRSPAVTSGVLPRYSGPRRAPRARHWQGPGPPATGRMGPKAKAKGKLKRAAAAAAAAPGPAAASPLPAQRDQAAAPDPPPEAPAPAPASPQGAGAAPPMPGLAAPPSPAAASMASTAPYPVPAEAAQQDTDFNTDYLSEYYEALEVVHGHFKDVVGLPPRGSTRAATLPLSTSTTTRSRCRPTGSTKRPPTWPG
jgi:hypothetical protein